MTTDDYVLLSILFHKQDIVDVSADRFANLLKLGIARKVKLSIELAEKKRPNRQSTGGQLAKTADKTPIEGNGKTRQALDFLSGDNTATSSQLSEITGLSQWRVREILNDLIEKGLITKVGNYRQTSYALRNSHE